MKKLGLVVVSLFAATTAIAADAAIPFKAPPPPPQAYNWSGFYVGAHGGHSWSQTKGTNAFFEAQTDQKIKGWLGGGQIGVNHQIGRAVIGVELSGS
jgi:outer membrane immunogenic protein